MPSQYTYNSGGQRTKLVEMSGTTVTETVDYEYNAAGELTELTDGSGALIVSYSYNNLGQVVKETFGNGTSTTYQYDADGNVLDLVNYAAGGTTVDSSFQYTYNALGQATTMTTLDGTWSYSYDTVGQLTGAVFAPVGRLVDLRPEPVVHLQLGRRPDAVGHQWRHVYLHEQSRQSVHDRHLGVRHDELYLQRQRRPGFGDRPERHHHLYATTRSTSL